MSDLGTETPDTTPTSSTEAAEQVLDAFEGTETTDGVELSGETPVPETETPAPVTAKALSEVEQLLHEEGFKEERRQDGRENRIPYSKVKRIIENGLKKGRADFDTRYGTVETQAKELQGYLDNLKAGVAGDTRAFMEQLAVVDPRYRSFLEQAQAQPAQPQVSDMPDPDLRLGDGSSTYSLEGLKKLLEWNTQQVEARLLPKVEERIKPFAEREQQAQQRQQAEQAQRQLQERTQGQMTEAQTWPFFGPLAADGTLTEVQTAVLAELQKDSAAAKAAGKRPSLTLEGAYIKVTAPKLVADRNKMRDELLKELNGAARGTAVSRGGAETTRAPGVVATTSDIAARTLARLEREGSQ